MPIPTSGAIWCPTGLVDRRGMTGYTPNSDDLISHLVFHSNWEDDDWLVVWNMFFSIIYGIILPIHFHILSYFSRWLNMLKPPTSDDQPLNFRTFCGSKAHLKSLRCNRSQVTYTRRKQTSECFNGEKFERPVSRKVPFVVSDGVLVTGNNGWTFFRTLHICWFWLVWYLRYLYI